MWWSDLILNWNKHVYSIVEEIDNDDEDINRTDNHSYMNISYISYSLVGEQFIV